MTAAVAGVGGALGGLVVLQALALAGWFFADGGLHGTTRDALRVGADAWLVGHGAHLTYGGVDYTVVPLGLTAVLAWAAYRAGCWAGQTAHDPEDDREALQGVGVLACGYLVVTVLAAVLAGTTDARSSLVLAVLGALVIGGGIGGAGVLVGAGRTSAVTDRLPAWAGPLVRSAVTTLLGLLACSALLVLVSFGLHLGSAMSLVSRLALQPGDALMLALASATVAPNAVLYAAAYLLGPGFAVGTGTAVSPSVVALGPVPSFPLLAALPGDGPTPSWATALLVVPPLVAAVAVALGIRRDPARSWDVAALRGVGSGVVAALGVALLTVVAGGALGDGRMADVGASAPRVLVSAALALGLGGLAGGITGMLLWRRTPDEIAEEEAAEEPTVSLDRTPAEPRVLVPSRPDEPTVRLGGEVEAPETPAAPVAAATPASDDEHTTEIHEEPPGGKGGEVSGLRELRARFLSQTRAREDDDGAE